MQPYCSYQTGELAVLIVPMQMLTGVRKCSGGPLAPVFLRRGREGGGDSGTGLLAWLCWAPIGKSFPVCLDSLVLLHTGFKLGTSLEFCESCFSGSPEFLCRLAISLSLSSLIVQWKCTKISKS